MSAYVLPKTLLTPTQDYLHSGALAPRTGWLSSVISSLQIQPTRLPTVGLFGHTQDAIKGNANLTPGRTVRANPAVFPGLFSQRL